jgi:hypothetical protein
MSAFGSPNFGENPETDRKEAYLLLNAFRSVVIVEADGSMSEPLTRGPQKGSGCTFHP